MKKSISKEQIVTTALELMRNHPDLRSLNLREIARTLGCAHTNLYNYFPSYHDLLWETHAAVQELFMTMLTAKLNTADTAEIRLSYFFEAFADIYLDNKGWFRLLWQEYVGGERPQRDIDITNATNQFLSTHIVDIWKELTGSEPERNDVQRVLHNTHCYMVGEISNYLLGRGLLSDEAELKSYLITEASSMFRMCLTGKAPTHTEVFLCKTMNRN